MTDLPLPQRPRWQPLRAGLVDIFHYDDEELRFRDGNLLLRGNNGTGKSKVLALLLPFLLDGQLTPSRVEPDGDPAKRMEWNLLLGGEYQERQGYVWVEFGRLDSCGAPELCTLGCGMRAVAGRGAPERWFFITPQRVRRDLLLVDANRRTLSRDRLLEALGDRGRLFTSASQYRGAVDERLFRLGRYRYEALVNLLIQLRQPQLSKRPDEGALSAALTEALPPLDQAVLNDVAEAFRNLEAERDELDALMEARRAVGAFLEHYGRYAAIAARRRGTAVREAQGAWDKTSGELSKAREDLISAQGDREREGTRQKFLDQKLEQARTRDRTLRESPEMRDARRIEDAEERALERARIAAGQEREQGRLAREMSLREARVAARMQAARAGSEDMVRLAGGWRTAAVGAGIGRLHEGLVTALDLPDGGAAQVDGNDPRIGSGAGQSQILEQRRRASVERMEALNRELDDALGEETRGRERWQGALDEGERLEERRTDAEGRVEEQAGSLLNGFRRFIDEAMELKVSDGEALLAELADWTRTLEGDNPAGLALRHAYGVAQNRIASRQADARQELDAKAAELEILQAERRRLDAGEIAAPPPAHTLDPEARRDRAGAPLWRLVDFRDETEAGDRAAIEAALESSGLLDAWVTPGGELLDPSTWDRVLVGGGPAGRGLGLVLRPAIDPEDPCASRVDEPTVRGLLSAIGWGEQDGSAWVSRDGRWRLGPARGAWGKEQAEYIGAGAREATRRRRLRELVGLIEDSQGRIEVLEDLISALNERRTILEQEWRGAPDDQALRGAHQLVLDLMRQRQAQQARIDDLAAALTLAREIVGERRLVRDEAATDLDLPAEPAALAEVGLALGDYARQAAGFWPSLRRHWDGLSQLREARDELTDLAERRMEHQEALDGTLLDLRRAREILHTLRDTLGAKVDELQRQLVEVQAEIASFEGQRKENEDLLVGAAARVSRLEERSKRLVQTLGERDQSRRAAVDLLQAFTAEGLLRIAAPRIEALDREGPWPLDPAVRLARSLHKELQAIDDSDAAWERHQRGLHEHFQCLQQTLSRHGHEAAVEHAHDLVMVRVVFQGRVCAPDELSRNLDIEVAERRALLDAKELELLEEHLVSDVAGHLQELMSDAERMVADINRELEARPTSTGMKLRLAWLPLDEGKGDAPIGLVQARKRLLRQSAAAWSGEDRKALGAFLHQRISSVRDGDRIGTLFEHLERALDYRHWHRFTVERWQNGRWRAAYGPASGGERALIVTLPLFAAASSHYSSASPEAPRLVMLDEAFAGIDDDARAKCLGLMSQFDLDFILTSEREWGCYPEVTGLAIAQLVRHEGIDAVYVSRWTWDGKHRVREQEPQALHASP